MRHMEKQNPCLIVSGAGGQGVTLLTQLLFEARIASSSEQQLAAVMAAEPGERSTLGQLYARTIDFPVIVGIADAFVLADATGPSFDPLGNLLKHGDVLVDVSSAAWPTLVQWADASLSENSSRAVDLLVVVSTADRSLRRAITILRDAEALRPLLGICKIGVVFNEAHGPFGHEGPALKALRGQIETKGYPIIEIEHSYVYALDDSVSIGRLKASDWETFKKLPGHNEGVKSLDHYDLIQAWIKKSIEAVAAAGFAPTAA